MASRTIDNIVTDDNMQLDKVIDNYFDIDNCSDPNPLTSGNINCLYHDIDTVCLHNLKDYRKNSKFSCMHIYVACRTNLTNSKKFLQIWIMKKYNLTLFYCVKLF